MRTIHKYRLIGSPGINVISHPPANFAHFAVQNGKPCIWLEVLPEYAPELHKYTVYPTGCDIPDGRTWLGTCLDGPYVWHLYEVDMNYDKEAA